MMLRVGPGSEVMAPHPVLGGGYILKTARVLVVMPELVIVEYYEDRMRHCLPKGAIRTIASSQPRLVA
jgi:hypothetical protein